MPSQTLHALGNEPRPALPWGTIGWWVMALASFASGFWAIFVTAQPDVLLGGQWDRMFAIPLIGLAHTVGGGLASLIGPFHFLPSLRRRGRRVHAWLGRAYLVAVGLSGIAGLCLSPGSQASNTLGIAFVLLALAWLHTGWQAYVTICRRDVEAHRRWMIRNFALTYAAVTLRIEMPILIMLGMEPVLALNVVGWTCWIPNLVAVEWWMNRKARRQAASA